MYNPIEGVGSGTAPVVNITWPFITKDHVKAKAGGVEVGLTWTGPSQVRFNVPVAGAVPYEVYRDTSRDAQLVDFVNGSVLTEDDLDKANLQLLYVSQEITSLIQKADLVNLQTYVDALQVRVGAAETAITGKAPTAHTHIIANVTGLQTALDGKQVAGSYAASAHSHIIADVTGLQTALDAKQAAGSYAAAAHTHVIADVTGLQTALNAKLAPSGIIAGLNVTVVDNGNGTVTIASSGSGGGGGATLGNGNYGDITVSGGGTIMTVTKVGGVVPSFPGHTHVIADVTGLQTALNGKQAAGSYAAAAHSHIIADVTGLQAALDGKQVAGSYAAAAHTHIIANVTGLQAALDGKQAAGSYAAAAHTHVIADTTGLQTALDAKAPALMAITSFSANRTITAADLGGYLRATAGVTITLDSGVSAGFSTILVNRSGANIALACSAGCYKNGATGTATTGTLAPGGRITLIHEGSGVWTADGKGLT